MRKIEQLRLMLVEADRVQEEVNAVACKVGVFANLDAITEITDEIAGLGGPSRLTEEEAEDYVEQIGDWLYSEGYPWDEHA